MLRDGFVPSVDEQALLDKVLDKYEDVLRPEPCRTDTLKLSVHDPVRNHPYRIPPRWKEEILVTDQETCSEQTDSETCSEQTDSETCSEQKD